MSDTNRELPPETVSVDVHIDRLCDRYEFLRKAGQAVTVGEFLRMEGIDPTAADLALVRGLDALAAWYVPGNQPTVVLPADATPDAAETLPEIRVGAVLAGRYELIEKIGEGGMGEVWRAHQKSPMSRMVAVKVIRERPGQNSRAILARFEAERQTLALMTHPNIAKVLDAGTTDAGRPFFVMDLIKGVPITAFCDARRLSPKERLELFVPVCRAIQHAHQKGIIHRDIKPDNVLVALHDDRPVPVVIDFGIAKAFGQALTVESVSTGHWAIVGTPEYMSPEQATLNQLDIDTRSDVYSLGVLLYELLTGTTPVDRKSLGDAAMLEVLRIVREVEAPRPSHRLSSSTMLADIATKRSAEPKKLGQQYCSELDWVLLKALEKDRDRRYASANAFAADIERHLANELVEATPPTRGYRLRKFYHRHRPQVIAASLVFLALVAGIVGTALGVVVAWQQTEIAKGETAEKEKARAAEAEQRGIAQTKEREADAEKVKALDAAAAEKKARLKEAEERGFAEAIAAFVKDDFLALTSVKGQYRFGGDRKEGLSKNTTLDQLLDRAAEKLRRRKDLDPRIEAELCWIVGVSYEGAGDARRGVGFLERAVQLRTDLLGRDHADTLTAMRSLSTCYRNADKLDKALPLLEEMLKLTTAKLGANHHDTLISMGTLAEGYQEVWKLELAIPLLEETLKLLRAKLGADHTDTFGSMGTLAACYWSLRQLDKSVPLSEKLLKLQATKLGADHPNTLATMANLALGYHAAGKFDKALPLFEETLTLQRAKRGPDHPDTLRTMGNLAKCYWLLMRLDKSVLAVRRVAAAARKEVRSEASRYASDGVQPGGELQGRQPDQGGDPAAGGSASGVQDARPLPRVCRTVARRLYEGWGNDQIRRAVQGTAG